MPIWVSQSLWAEIMKLKIEMRARSAERVIRELLKSRRLPIAEKKAGIKPPASGQLPAEPTDCAEYYDGRCVAFGFRPIRGLECSPRCRHYKPKR